MQPIHLICKCLWNWYFSFLLTLVFKDVISNGDSPWQLFHKITFCRANSDMLVNKFILFFFVLLWNFSSLGVRDSLDMFLVNRGFEFVNYLQYHFQCGLRQLTNFFNFIFSSKVGWVIRLCFLLYLFFVFLIFCGRHWKSIFLFEGIILSLTLPGCCPGNEVLLRVSTASHCRFKSRKTELTEAISLLDFPSMRQVSKCFLQIFFPGFLGFFYIIWWCKAFKTISHVNIVNYFGICIYMHLLRHKIRMQLVYMLA